jgi:hypothetical protein
MLLIGLFINSRLSYHYSHAHKYQEKELFYKINSAQKVLKLGYYDDVHTYLESAITLTVDIKQLTDILNIVQLTVAIIATSGPKSPTRHRRPSMTGILLSPNQTPRKAAQTAELPNKFTQLETNVKIKMEEITKMDGRSEEKNE